MHHNHTYFDFHKEIEKVQRNLSCCHKNDIHVSDKEQRQHVVKGDLVFNHKDKNYTYFDFQPCVQSPAVYNDDCYGDALFHHESSNFTRQLYQIFEEHSYSSSLSASVIHDHCYCLKDSNTKLKPQLPSNPHQRRHAYELTRDIHSMFDAFNDAHADMVIDSDFCASVTVKTSSRADPLSSPLHCHLYETSIRCCPTSACPSCDRFLFSEQIKFLLVCRTMSRCS
jgi:hypothetical protein